MSRFDYRDPGQDAAYCDALAPEPDDVAGCAWCDELLDAPHGTINPHSPYCSELCSVHAALDSEEN